MPSNAYSPLHSVLYYSYNAKKIIPTNSASLPELVRHPKAGVFRFGAGRIVTQNMLQDRGHWRIMYHKHMNLVVGKTALIQKFIKENFSLEYSVTVGVDFSTRSIRIEDTLIQLQIWDTVHLRLRIVWPRHLSKCYFQLLSRGLRCIPGVCAQRQKVL